MNQIQPMKIRTRANEPVEIRDSRRLVFYAAIFDSPTTVYDYAPGARERSQFREVVRAGAFRESLAGSEEIVANVDHDDSRIFGKRSDGLLLQEDRKGLFASIWLPDTELADQIIRDVNGEKIKGCSFRSRLVDGGDIWTDEGICQVVNAPLIDVCVTANPAYPQTEVKLRVEKYLKLFRRLRLLKLKSIDTKNHPSEDNV